MPMKPRERTHSAPAVSGLVTGQYTGVNAQWLTGLGVYTDNFYVLGDYFHTQYNTPAESQCTGVSSPAFVTPGPTACVWTCVNLISKFISQAWLNGSGSSLNYGMIQEYTTCSAPPGGSANYFQQVSKISPGCAGDSLSGTTVAWPKAKNSNLACNDQVLIVGLGGGTVKSVTDNCPGCSLTQLDNYNTSNACSLASLGTFETIRVNR